MRSSASKAWAMGDGGSARRGFRHVHSDEALRAYRARSPEEKLIWLHAAWRLTVDFLPPERREAWLKMRRGDI